MIDETNPYAVTHDSTAIYAEESERTAFIRRTYAHLGGAVLALIAIEFALFNFVPAATVQSFVTKVLGGYGMLIMLAAFMGVGMLARYWASSTASKPLQYLGLALYVGFEAIFLLPLLYIGMKVGGPDLPLQAAGITAICFIGLTAYVMFTKVDLNSWGKYLGIAGIAAMALIVGSILFGFSLGLFFTVGMIGLACGYILYDTSNVVHHYRTDQHVAASLALFASVVLLFWYVLRLMIALSGRD